MTTHHGNLKKKKNYHTFIIFNITFSPTSMCLVFESESIDWKITTWVCLDEPWGHPLSRYAEFSGKLMFLIPWYAPCAYQGVRNVSFSENFGFVLNGWPLSRWIYYNNVNHRWVSALFPDLSLFLVCFLVLL